MTKRISLDGEWSLQWCDEGEGEAAGWPASGVAGPTATTARVPGMTHLDLLAAGRIPEPLYGRNAADCVWMEEKDWWYSRIFELPAEHCGDRVEIEFEGLDTLADVWLNGEHVGSSRDALVPWRADVTSRVRAGANLLVVRVDTGLRWSRRQDVARYIPEDYVTTEEKSRIFLRRSAFSTQWDWAPRLATCGIWGPVRLESFREMALRDVCVRSQLAQDGAARLTVLVEVDVLDGQAHEAMLDFELEGEGSWALRATLAPGYNLITHTFEIASPRLWWPRDLGEPHLYQFACKLRADAEARPVDSVTFAFGVREVEVRQVPLPGDEGQSFTFVINGVPVFCKGANWVPADSLPVRVTPQRYETLLSEAANANFNMLRIWGGGTYETDAFWETCDRLGIMVWLDYRFAGEQIPEDRPEYLAEVQREAELVVRRLRNHASLILWCGNNESQWLHASGEWGNRPYFGWRTYHEVLAKASALLDPTRPYWPSSPYGGPGYNDWDIGDRHSWDISLGGKAPGGHTDHVAYALDRGKFISEYGFLAPPVRQSLSNGLPAPDLSPDSPSWRFHANEFETGIPRGASPSVLVQALDRYFGRRPEDLDLDAYLLLTQAWQAEAYRFTISHFRRRKFLTSGVLFWMYNDCWLATSGWTIIDYYLRRKPSYYAVRRAYAPEMVSFASSPDGLQVWLVNDHPREAEGMLEYGAGRFSDTGLEALGERSERVAANSSARVAEFPVPELTAQERADTFYWARWRRNGEVISRAHHWLVPWKDVLTDPPQLSWRITRGKGDHALEISTVHYAWMVVIGTPDDLQTEDNYFDLLPGETRTVRLQGPEQSLDRVTVGASNHLLGPRQQPRPVG